MHCSVERKLKMLMNLEIVCTMQEFHSSAAMKSMESTLNLQWCNFDMIPDNAGIIIYNLKAN